MNWKVVYQLERSKHGILIIVIGACADKEVYENAVKRIQKHNLI